MEFGLTLSLQYDMSPGWKRALSGEGRRQVHPAYGDILEHATPSMHQPDRPPGSSRAWGPWMNTL